MSRLPEEDVLGYRIPSPVDTQIRTAPRVTCCRSWNRPQACSFGAYGVVSIASSQLSLPRPRASLFDCGEVGFLPVGFAAQRVTRSLPGSIGSQGRNSC